MTDISEDDSRLTDEALLRLVAEAQGEALAVLYDRYGRLVFSVAFHIVGHQATAEEITLDVFRRVWEKADTYRVERANVRTWLTSMTRNRSIDVLRREAARPEKYSVSWAEVTTEPPAESVNPEAAAALTIQKQAVRAAIAQLPPEQQKVLALAYFQGYSHNEIAELVGLPVGTVKTRVRLAMQKLRQQLVEK